jgi:hypothetical protein
MKTRNEIVILDNEKMVNRTITEAEIIITPQMIAEMATNSRLSIRRLSLITGWGHVNGSINNSGQNYYTLELPHLPLYTRFNVVNGIMTPDFVRTTNPLVPMRWEPPAGMRLVCVFYCCNQNDLVHMSNMWLFAMKNGPTYWHLPLGNLHSDCKVCTGENCGFWGPTVSGVIEESMRQLEKSVWNADLWENNGHTEQMFRWKAENNEFTQLPPTNTEWTRFCTKVAPAVCNCIVL